MQKLDDRRLNRHVQRGRNLVAHEQLRLGHERAGDCHPLPLAAGQLVGIAVQILGVERGVLERGDDPAIAFSPGHIEQLAQRLRDQAAHGLARVERGVWILEHVLKRADHVTRPLATVVRERLPVELDRPGPAAVEPDDAAGQRRLARSRLPDHGQTALRTYLHRHVVENGLVHVRRVQTLDTEQRTVGLDERKVLAQRELAECGQL